MSDFVTLGDHISIQKGKAPLATGYSGPGAKPYLSPEYLRGRANAELAKPGSDAVHVRDGDTILLWDGSNAGEFFKAKAGLAASTMAKITPDERFRSAYFFHVTKHAEPYLKGQTNGTGIPHVDRELLEAIRVYCPGPAEQLRLAEILDTIDTAINETEAIIAKLKAVKQGLLHDLLTRGIAANGELRPPQSEAPHLYKESPLGWIPKEWEVDPVSNLTTSSVIGPFGSDLVASDYQTTGVPVVFVRDVKPDCLIWKSNVYVNARKARELAAHEVVPGDIVATKMGLPPCVAAVYPDSMPNGVVTADIVRLRPDLSRILPGWMSAFINAPSVIKQVEQITAGVTRPKVTLRDVRDLLLAVPVLEEQRLLMERVSAIEIRLRAEEQSLQKISAEKSGLMDDLLTGRVRVTPVLEEAAP